MYTHFDLTIKNQLDTRKASLLPALFLLLLITFLPLGADAGTVPHGLDLDRDVDSEPVNSTDMSADNHTLGAENLDLSSQLEETSTIQLAAGENPPPVLEMLEPNGLSNNNDRNVYFSFSGMGVWVENDSLSAGPLSGAGNGNATSLSVEIDAGNLELKGRGGYGATAAVGKKLWKGLRSEIEFAYRTGGFEDLIIRELSLIDIDFENAGYSTRSLLTNLIWDIPLTERFSSYIGGGVGLAWTSVSEGVIETSKNGLAWQLMGGVSYRATDRMELFGGYRYFATESQVRVWDHIFVDVDTHSAEVGVRYFLSSPEKKNKEGRSLFAFSDQTAKNPFYIGISGSAVQQQDIGAYFTNLRLDEGVNTQSSSFKAGYGLELVLGYKFCSFCRVELEYSYKNSKVSFVIDRQPNLTDLSEDPGEDPLGNSIARRSKIHALLINLYADLDIGNIKKRYGILPFAGIGLGAMYIDFKRNSIVITGPISQHITKARWAAQMAAGIGYSLTEQVTLGAQYKYLVMLGGNGVFGEADMGNGNEEDRIGLNSFSNNIGIHSLGLFARYNF